MNGGDRHDGWSLYAAIALIAVGVWMLLGKLGGPFWPLLREIVRTVSAIAWPVALIALGVYLLTFSRKDGVAFSPIRGRRLYRSRSDRQISGVLGGLGEYLGVDSAIVRVIYVLITLFSGVFMGVAIYFVASLIVPEEPLHGVV